MIKCPKNYTIPTDKWLVPLKVLHDDNNLIMDAELIDMINKEKVVAKITKLPDIKSIKNSLNTKKIYNIIKKSEHIINIYCFLTCNENTNNLENKYKDILGFCNNTNNNITINIESMKKYKHTLKRYMNKCSTTIVKNILRYLLNMQIELFCLYGFVHGDIHLGNIFIEKINPYKIKFDTSCNGINKVSFETSFKLYLTDFEYSEVFLKSINPDIIPLMDDFLINDKFTYKNTLQYNIYQTIYYCLDLLEDIELQDRLHKLLPSLKHEYLPTKILRSYAKGNKTEEALIGLSTHYVYNLCTDVFKIFFNENF